MSDERFKKIISVLIAITTVFAALLAQLEAEAGARDDRAARDAKQASLAAFGQQVRGDADSNYNYYTAFEQYRELETLHEAARDRDDSKAADRYEAMGERLLGTSPLLSGKGADGKPYFDFEHEYEPDLHRYQADTYYVDVQRNLQNFKAASVVKDGWDYKANAYVFHLTLLAVSLFLFGLAGTIATAATRMIFTGAGLAITALALGMAATTYLKPVPDLRLAKGAIDHYAAGMGFAFQDRDADAVKELDQAIAASPDYADAFLERGNVYLYQESPDLEKALSDYKRALELDPSNAPIYIEITFCLFQLGQFEQCVSLCQTGLKDQPENLQLQFQMALAMLASGKDKDAMVVYQKGLDLAAAQVASAKKEGLEPPSEVFANLMEASDMLDELSQVIEEKKGRSSPDKIAGKPEDVVKACEAISSKLASWEMALEGTSEPPKGELTAKLSNESFQDLSGASPKEPEEGNVFGGAPKQICLTYDFTGLKPGQRVVYRTFHDGQELDSWRWEDVWAEADAGSGEAEEPLYPGYSESFSFAPGHYDVEVYLDYQLALYASFDVVAEPE